MIHNGKEFKLYEFPRPIDQNYIVCQYLCFRQFKNFTILILPDNYKVEIGNESAEFILKDISVKANHGSISYDTELNEIIIKDNKS